MPTICQQAFAAGHVILSIFLPAWSKAAKRLSKPNGAGTLPAEYAKLDTLNYLDVHDNYLTGQLPSAWFTKDAFNRHTFLEVRTGL